MNEKLRILMQRENLTASKLAEILEVKPAAISHILSGRNKPSFELLCKFVNRFPQINPYWLMGDAQEIYHSEVLSFAQTTTQAATSASAGSLSRSLFDMEPKDLSNGEKSDISTSNPIAPISTFGRSDIDKIIIVYHDQTFEELRPKR